MQNPNNEVEKMLESCLQVSELYCITQAVHEEAWIDRTIMLTTRKHDGKH